MVEEGGMGVLFSVEAGDVIDICAIGARLEVVQATTYCVMGG